MNCRTAAALFSDQLEGALECDRSARLLDHLDGCAECAALYETMELNVIQLQGTPEVEMPEGLERRLAMILRREHAAVRAAGTARRRAGHWLFSNAMATGLLAVFIAANVVWFNPGFQDSIRGCRKLISDRGSRALELATDWSNDLGHLKEQVKYRVEQVRNGTTRSEREADGAENDRPLPQVNEIIRALGLIGT